MKSNFMTVLAGAVTSLAMGTAVAQSDFPSKDLSYIIPFGPGGESDISARLQQEYFTDITGQEAVIEYKPGGGGAVAWSQFNDMPADGHTIIGTNLPHIILQPLAKDVGFETEDLNNFYFFHYSPDAILVPADSPYQTLEDLVEAAEESPGAITFSGSGTYSANHVAQTRFDELAGITTTYIPYKGTGAAVTALKSGEVSAEWGYSTVAANHQDDTRMLAIASSERHPLFPDVPTFQELGYDLEGGAYRGMAVPQGTPEEAKQRLSEIFGEINQDPEFVQRMQELGFFLVDVPADEVDDFLAERRAEYEAVARAFDLID
jgi:tripartite-type tricarboxylate transporter receptor subunit TctC